MNDATRILSKLIMGKEINKSVLKAVRIRLELILAERERQYKHWQEHISHKLTATRQKEVRRRFDKTITALKIVIFELTPVFDREEEPNLINRKRE